MATAAPTVELRALPVAAAALPLSAIATASHSALVDDKRFVSVPALVLANMPVFCDMDETFFDGKTVRVMGPGQTDYKGNDISGFFVLSDVTDALSFDDIMDSSDFPSHSA